MKNTTIAMLPLPLLVSTLPLTMAMVCLTNILSFYFCFSLYFDHSQGRVGFMIWIWAIYFTFPGTYSTQPAVTTQVNRVFLNVGKNIFNFSSPLRMTENSTFIFIWILNKTRLGVDKVKPKGWFKYS